MFKPFNVSPYQNLNLRKKNGPFYSKEAVSKCESVGVLPLMEEFRLTSCDCKYHFFTGFYTFWVVRWISSISSTIDDTPFLVLSLRISFFFHQDVQTVAKPYGIHDS